MRRRSGPAFAILLGAVYGLFSSGLPAQLHLQAHHQHYAGHEDPTCDDKPAGHRQSGSATDTAKCLSCYQLTGGSRTVLLAAAALISISGPKETLPVLREAPAPGPDEFAPGHPRAPPTL